MVNASGQLGVAASSERFKDEIKPMDKASEAILALRPVTFRYKKNIDPDRVPQFGLVAEEVAKVNPDLVARDAKGEVYTVRYEAVNAMLLNEFLKEHRKVEKQKDNCRAEINFRKPEEEFRSNYHKSAERNRSSNGGVGESERASWTEWVDSKSHRERTTNQAGRIVGIQQSIEFDGNARATRAVSYNDASVV